MEPKFQTSFIPKGNFASPSAASITLPKKTKSFFAVIALIIFALAVIGAVGVFGYTRFLSYEIGKMGTDLENSRNSVEPDVVNQLIAADARITSTQSLLNTHTILSPFFEFLEENTLKTVRFTEMNYSIGEKGIQLAMRGEARGYQALALQSEIFNKSKSFHNPLFSNLRLDEKGNVTFSFTATVDPSLISYAKSIQGLPSAPVVVPPAATSTATTTQTTASQTVPKQTATTTATTSPRR